MRIALLTDGLWPDTIGGMQKHSFYLAKYLALNGHHVDVYYCANDPAIVIKQLSFDETLNIKFFKVDFPRFKFKFPGHYIINSYKFSKRIFKKYKEQPIYDFIYAQGFTGWYFAKKGISIGSNLHGLEMFQLAFGFNAKLTQKLLQIPAKKIIRKSTLNFSLGGKLTYILKQQGARKIAETPIGIDEKWLNKSEKINDTIQFIFIGRNEKRKALDIIFAAIQKMSNQNFGFHFIGIEKPENLSKTNLYFHGEIKDAEKIKLLLNQADVLVCPSLAEGMPTVILEAMAQSLPIIATDTGATSLLVDNNNGQLIDTNSVSALVDAMNFFIILPHIELLKLKLNAFEKVKQHFTWETSIQTTLKVI